MGLILAHATFSGSSSSSPSKEVPRLFEQIKAAAVMTANVLVEPPKGTKQWACGLDEGQPLFVRECYAWFYEEAIRKMSVSPKCPGLIYTGNPGIGKSAWLNYALVRFLQDGYGVVLERATSKDYYVFRDGVCTHKEKHVRRSVLDALPEKAVYLFDPDENDSHPLKSNVFTIVASSPQEKHYKALFKLLNSDVRYFPCWSLEELKGARPEMDPIKLEERWLRWGGIPRYVFDENQERLEVRLKKAVTGLDLSLVFKYLRTPEISEEDQKMISHILVQYRILEVDNAQFQCVELDFASDWIGERIVETEARRDYHKLIAHYEEVRRIAWQGAYCGHLWEHLCHAIIPLGAKEGLRLEPLTQSKIQNRRVVKSAVAVKKGKLEDMMATLQEGCYFQPSASNFPVIDALVMEGNDIFGLQMTVASSHPPKAYQTTKLLETTLSAGKKLHLVWVVDGAKEDHIKTMQSFQKSKSAAEKVDAAQMSKLQALPQWVLKLPFPKENPFARK